MRRSILALASTFLAGSIAWAGCGGDETSTFTIDAGSGEDTGPPDDPPMQVNPFDSGPTCSNLECRQVQCPPGAAAATTTIKGKVYDPRGVNPLYNVLVYIPNGTPQPFDDNAGVTCDRCQGAFATGNPIVSDLSKSDGSFELKNVPVMKPGEKLPMVVQVGKWRRVFEVPAVEACKVTEMNDPQVFRLARNSREGHIPKIAIALGGADPMECLLRKIGIDDSEFTLPTGSGRVAMYRAYHDPDVPNSEPAYSIGTPPVRMPAVSTLWATAPNMKKADMTLLPCEGTPMNSDKGADVQQTKAAYDNLGSYLDAGGRAFVTHYSKTYLEGHRTTNGSPEVEPALRGQYAAVANFKYVRHDRSDARVTTDGAGNPTGTCLEPPNGVCSTPNVEANNVLSGKIDDTFPKGLAFKEWLLATRASATPGVLPITDWRHNIEGVNKPFGQPWITADTRTAWPNPQAAATAGAANVVQHLTFNTPLNAPPDDAGVPSQCGKVVFSDFHVGEQARNQALKFPESCGNAATPMTAQEKALEFMLFDLSACIQKEDAPPPRPR